MHFFYMDESGDTGPNLADPHQPVIVLGGISVRDEGWNTTQQQLQAILSRYFDGAVPADFELHSKELLSPHGDGPFAGHDIERRGNLGLELLGLVAERSHSVHYIALDKTLLAATPLGVAMPYAPDQPYLVGFDYMITYINWYVRERLGISARGMVIIDRKDMYHQGIEQLMHERRFGGAVAHRVKWVVEFSYSVDSKKNPMIQLSDLVIYCTKRFIEIERGYRPTWREDARNFYARCYDIIRSRVARHAIVEREGRNMDRLNTFVQTVRVEPRAQWRRHYNLG